MRNTGEARSKAEQAQAGTYAKDEFDRASAMEAEAMKLYREKEFGPASSRFAQAVDAYKRAESDARTNASAMNQQRIKEGERKQADAAHQSFEDARTRAMAAGAERSAAAGNFRQALDVAAQAQRQLEQGDFTGARGRFDTASNAMHDLIGGLESERADWEAASRGNNLSELQRFVRKHPAGTYTAQAVQQIETLEWSAVSKDDPAALRGFLQKYPNSQFTREATKQIEGAEWGAVDRKNPAALRDYAQKHPNSPFAATAREEELKIDQAHKHDAEVEGIQQALTKYIEAFARMDAEAVQAIWPGMSSQERKTIQENFKDAESIQIKMLPVSEPKITGDTAVVTCRRQVSQKYRHGGDANSENVVTLTLRKQGSAWVIETVR
jgi:ketosteroid isomerase-like protein